MNLPVQRRQRQISRARKHGVQQQPQNDTTENPRQHLAAFLRSLLSSLLITRIPERVTATIPIAAIPLSSNDGTPLPERMRIVLSVLESCLSQFPTPRTRRTES